MNLEESKLLTYTAHYGVNEGFHVIPSQLFGDWYSNVYGFYVNSYLTVQTTDKLSIILKI